MPDRLPTAVGRAAEAAPPNRFLPIHVEADLAHLADDDELLAPDRRVATQFFIDDSQSLLTSNDSPDIHYKHSVNAYRGCEHGCVCSSIIPQWNLNHGTADCPQFQSSCEVLVVIQAD